MKRYRLPFLKSSAVYTPTLLIIMTITGLLPPPAHALIWLCEKGHINSQHSVKSTTQSHKAAKQPKGCNHAGCHNNFTTQLCSVFPNTPKYEPGKKRGALLRSEYYQLEHFQIYEDAIRTAGSDDEDDNKFSIKVFNDLDTGACKLEPWEHHLLASLAQHQVLLSGLPLFRDNVQAEFTDILVQLRSGTIHPAVKNYNDFRSIAASKVSSLISGNPDNEPELPFMVKLEGHILPVIIYRDEGLPRAAIGVANKVIGSWRDYRNWISHLENPERSITETTDSSDGSEEIEATASDFADMAGAAPHDTASSTSRSKRRKKQQKRSRAAEPLVQKPYALNPKQTPEELSRTFLKLKTQSSIPKK